MTRYRCKHAVEAMRWTGADRETFIAWHEKHTGATPWFRENQSASVWLNGWRLIPVGSWLVWSTGEFLVMDDEQFRETYEEVV